MVQRDKTAIIKLLQALARVKFGQPLLKQANKPKLVFKVVC